MSSPTPPGIERVLFTEEEIARRIGELGARISHDYAGKTLKLVGVLKGSVFFLTALAREIEIPVKIDFLGISSFSNRSGAPGVGPATREIESYWYPVWLTYPAGMLEGSRLVDARRITGRRQDVVEILKEFEFLVLFTSTMGLKGTIRWLPSSSRPTPKIKIAFVGPPVTTSTDRAERVPCHRLRLPP